MSSDQLPFSRRKFLTTGSLTASALMTARLQFLSTPSINTTMRSSRHIPTLTGNIEPGKLGITLMHEHLLFFNGAAPDDPGFQSIPNNLIEESVNFVVEKLNDAARVGIDTLVDVGPYRPIDLYEQIAKRSKVKIIVSTGFYRQSKLPPWFADMKEENAMVDYMTKEVTEGVGNTKYRAGIIKVAQEHNPMSGWETKVFTAAASVQKKTGVHIVTHTGNAVEQFDLLTKQGADPKCIYFSHVDVGRKGKVGDLIKLLKAGSYLEADTFAQSFYTPESLLVSFIRSVCDAGYAKQLFLSIDSNWHWVNGQKKYEGSEAPHFDESASKRTFAYMITDAVPMLLKSGFSLEEIKTFLIDNPRNYFGNRS